MITRELLSTKAFNMFRDWTKNVNEVYPDITISIIDETCLVNDLINSIKKARLALLNKDKLEKRKILGLHHSSIE